MQNTFLNELRAEKKLSDQSEIEVILNKAYKQPDLQDGIFDYIQENVMTAHTLLKSKQLDIVQQFKLKNILNNTLPELLDNYSALPVDYRNESYLSNGKTHRDVFLETIEILIKKIKKVENEVYPSSEMKDIHAVDKFIWNKEKFINDGNIPTPQRLIVQEGTIEYKVNSKFKDFMQGTYNTFTKFKNNEKVKESVAGAAIIVALGAFSTSMIYMAAWTEPNTNKDMLGGISMLKDTTNPELKSLGIQVLNDYAKNHKMTVDYKNDMLEITQKQSRYVCKKSFRTFADNSYVDGYSVNGIELKTTDAVSRDFANQACNQSENIVTLKRKF